jgi:hypothetical protein
MVAWREREIIPDEGECDLLFLQVSYIIYKGIFITSFELKFVIHWDINKV